MDERIFMMGAPKRSARRPTGSGFTHNGTFGWFNT